MGERVSELEWEGVDGGGEEDWSGVHSLPRLLPRLEGRYRHRRGRGAAVHTFLITHKLSNELKSGRRSNVVRVDGAEILELVVE